MAVSIRKKGPMAKVTDLSIVREQIDPSRLTEPTRDGTCIGICEFLHRLSKRDHRCQFQSDEAVSMRGAGLSDEERRMIRERDWQGLVRRGVTPTLLKRLVASDQKAWPHKTIAPTLKAKIDSADNRTTAFTPAKARVSREERN